MPIPVVDALEVDTLPNVPTQPPPPRDPDVFTSDDLAARWNCTPARVRQLCDDTSPKPPLAPGRRVGKQWKVGVRVWTAAEVHAYEAAHAEWVAKRLRAKGDD